MTSYLLTSFIRKFLTVESPNSFQLFFKNVARGIERRKYFLLSQTLAEINDILNWKNLWQKKGNSTCNGSKFRSFIVVSGLPFNPLETGLVALVSSGTMQIMLFWFKKTHYRRLNLTEDFSDTDVTPYNKELSMAQN